jgi:hypothetical protein
MPSKTNIKPSPQEKPEQQKIKTDDQLLFEINTAVESIALYTKQKKTAEAELLQRREKEIQQLLKSKPEPYGTVNLAIGNHQVKVDVKKKVDWDQEKLWAIWDQMTVDEVNPKNYIKAELKVSENAYKAWDDQMRAEFLPARTVTLGKPTIKLKDEE